ncbi:hypothetical protein LTR37_007561 [Vermiconidia calcicola]|uniref:Uncharacterized protein n=1 Tax=Vermiconidia calcicola TaxID=1690605 RepID=A0ACC3NDC4_9PEZI|nr:hypothetical protein LTR37_007561 [Vermiconidia calcicola]
MANVIEKADAQIASFLSDWSIVTTLIALTIVAFVAYPIIYAAEPDTHPLLLARQSSINPVRRKYESAVYRSPEVPEDTPLRTGLNVKAPGAPRWAPGKDGDLRDVWREAQKGGSTAQDGKEVPRGLVMTVLGKEEVVEHQIEGLSGEIRIIGEHLRSNGCKRLAVYLPNSVEYLSTVFACSFFSLTPILLPYNLPHPKVYEILNTTSADSLICAAGNLPLDDVTQECKNLKLLTWVVEKTSRHMDWNGVPDAAQERLNVSVWHDIVEENKSTTNNQLPSNDEGDKPGDVVVVSQPQKSPSTEPEIVTFTQSNLVSAIAALISALPLRQRLSAADLVLPASSFSIPYVLSQTMAALYQHASLAITSVAEPGVDLTLATRSIAPTVIIASAETMAALHDRETASMTSSLAKRIAKYSHSQAMSAGRMPTTDDLLFKLLAPSSNSNKPGRLRLILTSERLGSNTPPLTSTMLSDLRIFTRARICYALTAPQVAGAIAQTHVFDYRREEGSGHGHFGLPLSSVEIKLANKDDGMVAGSRPEGEIVVSGPAVAGERGSAVNLGVMGCFREDGTLAFV